MLNPIEVQGRVLKKFQEEGNLVDVLQAELSENFAYVRGAKLDGDESRLYYGKKVSDKQMQIMYAHLYLAIMVVALRDTAEGDRVGLHTSQAIADDWQVDPTYITQLYNLGKYIFPVLKQKYPDNRMFNTNFSLMQALGSTAKTNAEHAEQMNKAYPNTIQAKAAEEAYIESVAEPLRLSIEDGVTSNAIRARLGQIPTNRPIYPTVFCVTGQNGNKINISATIDIKELQHMINRLGEQNVILTDANGEVITLQETPTLSIDTDATLEEMVA